MTDFFGALELELRAAARRRPRRPIGIGHASALLAGAALVAAAVALSMAVRGGGGESAQTTGSGKPDPVGTVIPEGEGTPPRSAQSRVVATGTSPGIGPWQMEVSRSSELKDPDSGAVYQPAGLRCLSLFPVRGRRFLGGSGQCGEFPRTPGFSRLQLPEVRFKGDRARQERRTPLLVYGWAPERAARVVVTAPGGLRVETRPLEGPKGTSGDFYAISVPRGHHDARVNWLNAEGNEGSRGIRLLPPLGR
jgi:hypothetical protein